MKWPITLTFCIAAVVINCIDWTTSNERLEAHCGGIAWIGTESLLYLSQEHWIGGGFLSYEDSIIGTKLIVASVSKKLSTLNSVELLPERTIIEDIKLHYLNRLIAYECIPSNYNYNGPSLFFYDIDENKFDSSQFKNFRIISFTPNGNLFAEKGRWDYSGGVTCGYECSAAYRWSGYKYSAVIDNLGNEIYDSIPAGVPSPVENLLITSGPPIKIRTFPIDSTLFSIPDSSTINLISWSADGSKFMYVDTTRTAHTYSYSPNIAMLNIFHIDIKPDYARISPNGDYIAVCNKDSLIIYDRNGKPVESKIF